MSPRAASLALGGALSLALIAAFAVWLGPDCDLVLEDIPIATPDVAQPLLATAATRPGWSVDLPEDLGHFRLRDAGPAFTYAGASHPWTAAEARTYCTYLDTADDQTCEFFDLGADHYAFAVLEDDHIVEAARDITKASAHIVQPDGNHIEVWTRDIPDRQTAECTLARSLRALSLPRS